MMKGFGGLTRAKSKAKNKKKGSKVKPGRVAPSLPNLKAMKELQQQLQSGQGLDDLLAPDLQQRRKDQPWP